MLQPSHRLALGPFARPQEASPESNPPQAASRSSRPVYFGAGRPLFGWLHLPESGATPQRGLLICNPFGNEAICAHRTLRHIAERACQSGLAVLRFDYDGTGDSPGDDLEPERVQSWLRSTSEAADELRRIAGVERLCVLGIRLGATLGATVAARRTDVEALIAIAPVVTGKTYVRELRLLQRAMEAKRDAAPRASDEFLEAAGFELTAATQAALGALDLKQLEKPPAPHVLILERAEMPGDSGWTAHLERHEVQVTRKSFAGYTEMMLDSHESVVPTQMLAATFDWLSQLSPQPAPGPLAHESESQTRTVGAHPVPPATLGPALSGPRPTEAHVHGPSHEQAVHFGPDGRLFGIISKPAGSPIKPAGPPLQQSHPAGPPLQQTHPAGPRSDAGRIGAKALLLVNSGAVHRVGPNRLYVKLARHFALHGYLVLRMDISGLGDSPPQPGAEENVVYSKYALQDVGAALEYLQRDWGVMHIHAMGLCSGAYNVFKAAVAGLPLAGVTLINPLTFFWKDGMSLKYAEHRVAEDIVRYRTNAFRLKPWLKLLRGEVNLWELAHVLARRVGVTALKPARALARRLRIPLRDDLPTELKAIVRRGIKLQFVFAASDPGLELLTSQAGGLVRKLRTTGKLQISTIEAADHTFTGHAARLALLATLDQLLD